MISIYTDGGYSQKYSKGKAALIIVKDNKIIYQKTYQLYNASNNISEMTALLKALEIAKYYTNKYNSNVIIYSDSRYCVDGYNKWLKNWQKNNWKRLGNKKILNKKLWQRINEIRDAKIKVKWIKGHNEKSGSEHSYYNSVVDKLTR